jgi:hypothetical protein
VQERRNEVAVNERRASRLDRLIDPTRRMSLVSLCWACGLSERDPSRIAAMKRCVGCRGMHHATCMSQQVRSLLACEIVSFPCHTRKL